ncbi:MAG: reverse gyrase [Desulfurococcaceae archaeon]
MVKETETPIGAMPEVTTRAIYRHACPNCGGPISDSRLLLKVPCEECIPEEELRRYRDILDAARDKLRRMKILYSMIRREGRLRVLLEEEKKFRDFEHFFEKATRGFKMWSAQKTWARRLLRRESFSIIAPTGMGKTVFSLIASLYKVEEAKSKNKKIYLAFPTTPLLLQAWKRLLQFAENAGLKVCSEGSQEVGDCIRVICIHGKLSKKEREELIERIKKGDFDILLTTSAFLHKHAGEMPRGVYELIVMDDVDAVLRSGKAVRRLLNIIGFDDKDIDLGLELIKLRAKLALAREEEAEKLRSRIQELHEAVNKAKKSIETILIVNSATGRPRGVYPKLFKVFLDFEAGSKPEAIRNVVDSYLYPAGKSVEDVAIEVCLRLKDGILVFVPIDKGVEYAEHLASKLRELGIAAEAFHAKKSIKLIEDFASGKLNALVGVATYYGTMVRGLDLPERAKYVVFVGVPRHKFSSRLENVSPLDILRMLLLVREVLEGERKNAVDVLVGRLSKRLRTLSPGALLKLRDLFSQVVATGLKGDEPPVLVDLYRAYELLREALKEPEVWDKLSGIGEVAIVREGEEMYILIPDVATYIQASGRCSRLYPGGITKGLAVVVVDDERLFRGLARRMRWIFEGFKFVDFSGLNLDELVKEIESERAEVARIIRGEVKPEKQLELVKTAMLIVESPNKAKTIANFFGKPSIRVFGEGLQAYEVTVGNYVLTIVASGGHVYDLVVDPRPPEAEKHGHLYGVIAIGEGSSRRFIPIYTDIKKCPAGHQFTDETDKCPKCELPAQRKQKIIEVLRKLASEVDEVLIGTDPDAEGEKIAWDLRVLLEPYANEVRRVEFHEVTRRALLEALANPRDFNVRLVEAQIVRRVEDRWLGFSLSELVQKYAWLKYCMNYLYKKREVLGESINVKEVCCNPNRNLSAGRVQTPVLGFIVKEFEKSKKPEYSKYIVNVVVEGGRRLTVTLNFEDALKAGMIDLKGRVKDYPPVEIKVVEEREEVVNPPPPFTTDMLLEEASRLLGFSAMKTMDIAQDLFETGLITYHRTDSTRVSDVGIDVARQYLEDRYGPNYTDVFKPRTWGVGGAHEAIRPTRPVDADRLSELMHEGAIVVVGRITRDHLRLYDLIFRRFIASQMKPATVKKQKLHVRIGSLEHPLEVEVVTDIVDKGYLEIYENIEVQCESLGKPGTTLSGYIEEGVKVLKHPLPRYHDVVRWMKENGIGRPSTYAKIIQTIVDRKYVRTSKKGKALVAMERGIQVYNFLSEFFGDIVGVEVTRKLEENMDRIERGELDYQELLNQLYNEVEARILSEDRQKAIEKSLENELKACDRDVQ